MYLTTTSQPCKKFNWPMEKLIGNLSFAGLITSGKLEANSNKQKIALLSVRKKVKSQPQVMNKYCEKIEKAIAKGHIVRVQN